MTLKCYSPGNKPLGFLNNVFDLKITKEIGGMEELTFFIPANSPEAKMIQLEGYIVPEGEQIFVIRELNTHGKDIEVYCMLAIETLYGYCWSEIAKQNVNLVEAFEYVLKHTGWKFVNRTSTPARTRDIYIQNQTVWEALKVLCEVYFIEMTVDTHTHTITAYDSVGQDNGVFFISDMNLVNFRKDTNTHKLITRLIPIGKDGLNITSVNGGKDYIDNNTYSDKLLYGLWMQSAYTNPTQLKEDATKWLAEYAKPYITYNIDIIDLYRLNGNQLFKFNVGDGVTIFDKVTEEKVSQRVVKIEIYPQDPTRNTLELSNKGKTFSDYFQMIQLMQNMANHFIQTNGSATGTGGTNGSSNPNLKDDIINGDHIQSDSIGTDHLQSGSITTDKITSNSITTDKLVANSVTTDKLTANSITSDKIQANSIKTEHLQANIIDSNKIFAGAITTDKLQAGSVTANKIASNSITTDKLVANSITSNKIQANTITTSHLQANSITSDKIGANAIEAKHIKAGVIDSQHISSESIKTEHLQAGSITSDNLQTGIITAKHLQTGSITAEKIQTGAITAGSGIIANGAIGNAQISSINANKINAGEIDTSKVKVKGSNGYLFIEDNTLYVVDNKKQIRCELGVISNKTNYGFIVRGADGKTILIDHNGVHNAGITDGAIDNRKVSENANISGKKLDIDSVIRTINEDGSISIRGTKVQVGNTTLDVELSKQTNLINNHTTQLNNQQASINANTNAIKLKVDNQTYTADKNNMTTQMNKNTSAISILEKEIDLKVEQSDITTAVNNVNKTIDTKISTAKSEIKATTDSITQSVSSVQSTTSKLQSDLNKLEVGGRNFVLNGGFSGCVPDTQTIPKWITWGSNIKVFYNQGTSNYNEPNTLYLANRSTSAEGMYQIIDASVIPPNTEITISGRLTKEGSVIDTSLSIEYYDANNTRVSTIVLGSGEIKKTITTLSNYTTLRLVVHHKGSSSSSSGYLIRVSNIKIEKGNKATSWTPAIEDVQSQLDSNASNISSTTTKVASIETNLNGITQRVASTETTTTTLQKNLTTTSNNLNATTDKLNNLTVGGRNLIRKSNVVTNNATGTYNATTNTWTLNVKAGTGGTWGCGLKLTGTNILIPYGKSYVLSFEVKVPRDCRWNADINNYPVSGSAWASNDNDLTSMRTTSGSSLVANQWIKCWVKWENKHGGNTNKLDLYDNSNFGVVMDSATSDMTFEIRNIQGELGNMPTEYTPSPEDVQSQIDSNASEISTTKSKMATIETNLNGITQKVSSVESTTTKLNTTTTNLQNSLNTTNTTLNNTTSKLNNLTVGGKNLISNSAPTNLTGWEKSTGWNLSLVGCTNAPYGKATRATATVAGTTGGVHKPLISKAKLVDGAEYTISAWVRASKQMNINFRQETMNTSNWVTINTSWKYITFTKAIIKSAQYHSNTFYVSADSNVVVGDWFEVHSLKLEKGNKATDWSPSPDEVQDQLNTNTVEINNTKSKVATVETNLSGITSRVSNVETKTTNIDGRVTSQEARIKTAESKITDSAIINTVSSTIDTKVNNSINNLSVGGRNLVKNSAFIGGTTGWSFATNVTLDTSRKFNGHSSCKSAQSGLTSDNWRGCISYALTTTENSTSNHLKAGQTYTASCWYYVENKSTIDSAIVLEVKGKVNGATSESGLGLIALSPSNIVQGEWTRMSITFTPSKISNDCCIRAYVRRNGTAWFTEFKLEKGNKVTDWSPAPEDIESKVDSQYSELKQTASSITATVSDLNGKYTQIKQTVDNIDLTGKVSFSDLSTAGKTTINGANIKTGTLSADVVNGGTLKGVSLQTYSGTNTSGVRIHPGGMQLNDTSFFYNNEGKFELQCKQGVAFSSQKDIHIMPGLLASGTPSGSGNVVIPSATLRTQKLYVVNSATFESGLTASNILSNGVIYGRNNITLNRGSVYIPRLNSNITTDYLRLGGAYISGADSGAIHFNYSSSRSGALARGTVFLPSGGGNNTTDHLAFHSGIIACVDSGNFHFVTAGGGNSTIYPRGVVATYSLDNVARTRTTSKALDIVSSVPVTQTVEGFMLDAPKARTVENEQLITTSENEQTGELDISTNYNAMLGTMWKAIQELQQEVNTLKEENRHLKQNLVEQGVATIPN